MTIKSSPSIIRRFTGNHGRQRLIEALVIQPSIAGDRGLATTLSKAGNLRDLAPETLLTIQGEADNDLFFIISGEVSITINGRVIASRQAGCHVGEMSLLDPTARRSATVKAIEQTLVFRVPETRVTQIATAHPEFWRRIAVELGARLRERSKLISPTHAHPVIFVGSSSEGLMEANWISQSLNRRRAVSRLWTQGVFQVSKTTIEGLFAAAAESDFAVIVLTPDDMTSSRRKKQASPRDNVVFELGLFMGGLGRERSFILTPRGEEIKLPTDLLGITRLQYKKGPKKGLGVRLRPVSQSLWKRIKELGPK
jgi:CRP/FNR family transcriptional regulator, cyclic AMP receptor protein